jgi:hypothetical protein
MFLSCSPNLRYPDWIPSIYVMLQPGIPFSRNIGVTVYQNFAVSRLLTSTLLLLYSVADVNFRPKGRTMRLLFIIVEASVEHRVIEILERCGAPGHTRFTGATGDGKRGRREGTSIWPGLNTLLMAAMPEEIVPLVNESLQKLEDERGGRLAVKVFAVPTEEYQ